MDKLYELKLFTWPNGEEREWSGIGLFAAREDAARVAAEYLDHVPGFCDYYCEPEICEVPLIGSGDPEQVWRFVGWNEDEYGDDTDIIESGCYTCREQAQAACDLAQKHTPRQEWALNRWIIGQKEWQEGFTREYPGGRTAPTLKEVRAALADAMDPRQLMKVCFHYSDIDRHFFPLSVSRDLFLCAEEDDFLLDGFTVRRIRDVEKLEPNEGLYTAIMAAEGWLDRLAVPEVDLSGWQTVFTALKKLGRNIIVEEEHLEGGSNFAIGFIQAVAENHVCLLRFDADGIWDAEPVEIFYADITSVSFETRYINIFSKYLPPRS